MRKICSIERFDDHLVIEVWDDEVFWFQTMVAIDPDWPIGSDVGAASTIEIDDIDDAEFVVLEFPPGIPNGYGVFTFYKGRGHQREVIKSVLYGPRGIIGAFSSPNAASSVAVADADANTSQAKPPGT